MSTTYPSADSLRIPPKPRKLGAKAPLPSLPAQLLCSAVAAFGLAWLLSSLMIG